jgi:DNA polymerase delta subunit 2
MAVLGMETSSGDFEVIDLCFAGLPDIYTPTASTSANGKGKAKAKDTEMELDGKSSHYSRE